MNKRLAWSLSCAGALLLSACGGGGGGGSATQLVVKESSNGFGTLLPHRVFEADDEGMPTGKVVEIRRLQDLFHVTTDNPIFAPIEWPAGATLPNGDAGNHFLYTRFSQLLDVDSVLDGASSAAAGDNLTGAIKVLAVDPVAGTTTPVRGRAFVGGQTYGSADPDDPTRLRLERWIGLSGTRPVALSVDGDFPGLGFPGTQSIDGFAGSADLVHPTSFVFVPDADDDLTTLETFPLGAQISMRMTREVRSLGQQKLAQEALASSTVGGDTIPPEIAVAGQNSTPDIVPGNGDFDVDPETVIAVKFTEPVQLRSLGRLDDGTPPPTGAAVQLLFGPVNARTSVPFHVRPLSVYDLTRFELVPTYNFPGSGPTQGDLFCGTFSQIDVVVNAPQLQDLSGNTNTITTSTFFTTGEGPGLVNAPVLPDVVYVARGGSQHGISVIDLNGFGQGTGNPTYDPQMPIKEGNTNFPNNPNVALQGSQMIPPLSPGTCTIDGGSAGIFSLTKDSSLRDIVAGAPILDSVGDMMIGHSLDTTFNNSLPFGCQAGGGNICASTGLKIVAVSQGGGGSLQPSGTANVPLKTEFGVENLVSWGPHPNPPPLSFPPLCLSPLIGAREPTSIIVILPPPPLDIGLGLSNLLGPSAQPLGNPLTNTPPQGLIAQAQTAYFSGPQAPQSNILLCRPYDQRQQIGQFLYVIDRAAQQVVVFNSNRFTVIERISLPDPTDLAMSPNLDFLAVSNQSANLVSIVDIDPTSATFHEIVKQIPVGVGPVGVSWHPGNEDILVCNEGDDTVSVISVFTLTVRKLLGAQLNRPFQVLTTPRQINFTYNRGVYFAYILNSNGSVAIFESGPDGINGWGFDDVIGLLPFTFTNPKAIQADMNKPGLLGAWICHENPLDANGQPTGEVGGAVSNLAVQSLTTGIIPLDPGSFVDPQIREIEFQILASIGETELTGVPLDVAFDNQVNAAALTNHSTQFSPGDPLSINGKCLIKPGGPTFYTQSSVPQFMFLAVPTSDEGPGVVDVIEISSTFGRIDTNVFRPGIQSIPVTGAIGVTDYFRQ